MRFFERFYASKCDDCALIGGDERFTHAASDLFELLISCAGFDAMANDTNRRTVRLAALVLVAAATLSSWQGADAIDLMKLFDARQHRSFKRAGECTNRPVAPDDGGGGVRSRARRHARVTCFYARSAQQCEPAVYRCAPNAARSRNESPRAFRVVGARSRP